jgi:RNA polymerase sigma-70 factor (ECF subfamily)
MMGDEVLGIDSSPKRPADAEFLALLGRYDAQLVACVHMIVPQWHAAEEVLQETRLTLWRKFESFQRGSDFLAWARTIARYCARAHFRAGRLQPRLFGDELTDTLMTHVANTPDEENRRWTAFLECSRSLGAAARLLMQLAYVERKKISDVAKQLGRSVNGTHVALCRIRRRLAECMERRLQEAES